MWLNATVMRWPFQRQMVGLGGLEPPTSRLSGVRSSQLSYRPMLASEVASKPTDPNVKERRTAKPANIARASGSQSQIARIEDCNCRNIDLVDRIEAEASWGGLFYRSKTPPPGLLRKEVIQPQVPLRLPCYDFTPVTNHSLGGSLLAVGTPTSGAIDSHGVTGGVYKARERIHRSVLICDY